MAGLWGMGVEHHLYGSAFKFIRARSTVLGRRLTRIPGHDSPSSKDSILRSRVSPKTPGQLKVAIGLLVSAVARTAEGAAGVLPLVILPTGILEAVLLSLHDLPRSPIPMHAVAGLMPLRWAFKSLLLPEAESLPKLDTNKTIPQVVTSSENTQSDIESYRDMAEEFFKRDDRLNFGSSILLFFFKRT